ncbi:17147_t:CDS:2 [Dentiscutata heterogama]|uniref:17147_t:CDS:1 n=1 Tax=Dentiscutata heterogama TaxID=1316150 RepID=A0ACA9L7D0_9GLOM|nr:17147_t:CDS:2 [Dentiscutata heterogama]
MSITFLCLVRGEPITRAFAIDIDSNMLVSYLKKVIKSELHPQFDNVPSKDIKLWKVEIRDNNIGNLDNLSSNDDNELLSTRKVKEYWPKTPEKEHIHIITSSYKNTEYLGFLPSRNMKKILLFSFLCFSRLIEVKSGKIFNSCLYDSFITNNPYNSLLNYNFSDDIVIRGDLANVDISQICCTNFKCLYWPWQWDNCTSFNDTLVSNNSTFLCNKIGQNYFCYNGDGLTCAGIVGNFAITSNITLGNCTGKENLDGVANYLANISVNDGNTHVTCTNHNFCSDLECWWDNEVWTCHNPDYAHISDYTNQNCFLQLIISSSTINSTTPTFLPTFSSSANIILVIVGCLIGIIGIAICVTIIYFWRKQHRKDKYKNFSY